MLDRRWRAKVEQGLDPLGRGLHLLGVSADGLTLIGLAIAVGTGVLIANGNLLLAVFGVVLTGLPDVLDGSVARHSGTAGARGAFFDSVCDRVADAALGIGLAFDVLVPVLWVMLALTTLTAVHRFVMVWRQASVPGPDDAPAVERGLRPAARRLRARHPRPRGLSRVSRRR